MPWLASFGAGVWAKIAAAGAILLAITIAVARIFSSGKKAERAANNEKAVEAGNVRTQVDVDVATAPDADRERLRKRWTRD